MNGNSYRTIGREARLRFGEVNCIWREKSRAENDEKDKEVECGVLSELFDGVTHTRQEESRALRGSFCNDMDMVEEIFGQVSKNGACSPVEQVLKKQNRTTVSEEAD